MNIKKEFNKEPIYDRFSNLCGWSKMEEDVVERIRLLSDLTQSLSGVPNEKKEKIMNEIVVPQLELLSEFIMSVDIQKIKTK